MVVVTEPVALNYIRLPKTFFLRNSTLELEVDFLVKVELLQMPATRQILQSQHYLNHHRRKSFRAIFQEQKLAHRIKHTILELRVRTIHQHKARLLGHYRRLILKLAFIKQLNKKAVHLDSMREVK